MVKFGDTVFIRISKEEAISCLDKTKRNNFIDNLRHRHPNVQFDCKLLVYR